jgi:hypothetical protein
VTTPLPIVYLARHGETAWTLSGQHTGLADLPLTVNGEGNARRPGERLKGQQFAKVFTSPLQRAARTCELAGFADMAEMDPALVEWNYGEYERLRSADIRPDRHFLRVLATRWLGFGPESAARYFLLSTATLSALGYEHKLSQGVIRLWNDDHHVGA